MVEVGAVVVVVSGVEVVVVEVSPGAVVVDAPLASGLGTVEAVVVVDPLVSAAVSSTHTNVS